MHTPPRNHPLVLVAAVAVIIFSLLGSAAITGLIPAAQSERAEPVQPPVETSALTETSDDQKKLQASPTSRKPTTKLQPSNLFTAQTSGKEKLPSDKETKAAVCATCGVIESIRMIQQEGEGSGLGAVAGGVTGGLIGNQIGKGKGNTVMTILGAGGGAYAGHTIEKKMKSTTSYVIDVRMEDGSYRTVTKHSQPEYAVGDHVRVISGNLKAA